MESEMNNVYTWPLDSAFIVLRYFFIAGTAYFIFYKWKQELLNKIKIQKEFPDEKIIRSEIVYSISTLTIYCLMSWLVFKWYEWGITEIYTDISQFGYAYFFTSIVIMIFVHDTYFYWTHRLMHLPGIFKWVHQVHHRSHNPTPWAAFSFHPLEALISVGIIPIVIFAFPCHPYSLFIFLTFMTVINVIGHLGYEPFPKKFRRNRLGRWQNTSTNHNVHHQLSNYNFGLYFTFWDRVMETCLSDSHSNAGKLE